MLDRDKLAVLIGRIHQANSRTFHIACKALVAFVEANAAPGNSKIKQLNIELEARWSKWIRDAASFEDQPYPESAAELASLAWALVVASATLGSEAINIFVGLSRRTHYDEALALFNEDFGDYFDQALDEVLDADSPPSVSEREKDQKFRVLDSPFLLEEDLKRPCGMLGRVLVYADIDDFKALNTRLLESVVDKLVLPRVHELFDRCTQGNGFVYAEGGDEFTFYLPNATIGMGAAFADAIRTSLERLRFDGDGSETKLMLSLGVAWVSAASEPGDVRERANAAKRAAKAAGKNRVVLAT